MQHLINAILAEKSNVGTARHGIIMSSLHRLKFFYHQARLTL